MTHDNHAPVLTERPAPLLMTCIFLGEDAIYVAGALNERDVSAEEFTREAILEHAAR